MDGIRNAITSHNFVNLFNLALVFFSGGKLHDISAIGIGAQDVPNRSPELFIAIDRNIERLNKGLPVFDFASILVDASSLANDGLAWPRAKLDMDL